AASELLFGWSFVEEFLGHFLVNGGWVDILWYTGVFLTICNVGPVGATEDFDFAKISYVAFSDLLEFFGVDLARFGLGNSKWAEVLDGHKRLVDFDVGAKTANVSQYILAVLCLANGARELEHR